MLKCSYCEYVYENPPISTMQLHLCADQEYHFIDRIDLKEKPLKELTKEIKPTRKRNLFTTGVIY